MPYSNRNTFKAKIRNDRNYYQSIRRVRCHSAEEIKCGRMENETSGKEPSLLPLQSWSPAVVQFQQSTVSRIQGLCLEWNETNDQAAGYHDTRSSGACLTWTWNKSTSTAQLLDPLIKGRRNSVKDLGKDEESCHVTSDTVMNCAHNINNFNLLPV